MLIMLKTVFDQQNAIKKLIRSAAIFNLIAQRRTTYVVRRINYFCYIVASTTLLEDVSTAVSLPDRVRGFQKKGKY